MSFLCKILWAFIRHVPKTGQAGSRSGVLFCLKWRFCPGIPIEKTTFVGGEAGLRFCTSRSPKPQTLNPDYEGNSRDPLQNRVLCISEVSRMSSVIGLSNQAK